VKYLKKPETFMLSIKAALMKNNNKYRCDKIDRNYIYENYLPTFIVI